ncbi:ABC transporter ATP-binding protein [Candidatus Riflebacteria bacterium]
MSENLLEIQNLVKFFPLYGGLFSREIGRVHAVDDISFSINEGEVLGLVGESGCGKSTTGRTIMRLIEPSWGKAFFFGEDLFSLDEEALRLKRREIQMIFQDPYASLNPRMTIGDTLEEPLIIHQMGAKAQREEQVKALLDKVGLPANVVKRYPHEFSGGQRQRIGIARALAVRPRLIIADEPVSALDVSIQAQVINLMQDLKNEFGLTYLFIAHDLAVVEHISDRVAVMYLGRIVEIADSKSLYRSPKHPYTQALLSAVPVPDPEVKKDRIILEGDIPNPIDKPSGCRFHTRCPKVRKICKTAEPDLNELKKGHSVSCFIYEKEHKNLWK